LLDLYSGIEKDPLLLALRLRDGRLCCEKCRKRPANQVCCAIMFLYSL